MKRHSFIRIVAILGLGAIVLSVIVPALSAF